MLGVCSTCRCTTTRVTGWRSGRLSRRWGGLRARSCASAVALVAEESALLDELADLGRHLRFPGLVLGRDRSAHIAAEDGQVLGRVVVQPDEAAAPVEVVVQGLQILTDGGGVNGDDLTVPHQHGVDEELEIILEEAAEALEDAAGQVGVAGLVEQAD